MSKCLYKDIADSLDKNELAEYYKTHLTKDVCKHFNFDRKYFYRIFHYLNIPLRSTSESTKLQMQVCDLSDRNVKIKNALSGRKQTKELIEKRSNSQKGKVVSEETKKKISSTLAGNTPWNKGLRGVQHWDDDQKKRYYESLNKNGWYKKSKPEKETYQYLIDKYGQDDVKYQYASDERYPFNCDFYIPSKDLFVELNIFWHHGTHPYNENSDEDKKNSFRVD